MENPKSQILNSKQITMNKTSNYKQYKYNLEERTEEFARRCRDFVKKIPRTISNIEYGKQLIRSSSSQAANYIEANESLSKKDYIMRTKISKKETKESRLWLRLIEPGKQLEQGRINLIQESEELMRIFGSILEKSK